MSSDEDDSLLRAVAASPPVTPPARSVVVQAASEDRCAPDLVDTSAFELARWGLRFVDRKVESDYRHWHVRRAVSAIRAGMIALIVGALMAAAGSRFGFQREGWTHVGVWACVAIPLFVTCIAMTFSARLAEWSLAASTIVVAIAGVGGIVGSELWTPLPEILMSFAAVYWVFVASTMFRVRFAPAAAIAAAFVAIAQVYLVRAFDAGRVSVAAYSSLAGYPGAAFIVGMLVCIEIDRTSRGAYRQERITNAQREVIDRLQRAEVQRQVAERSRGLSEALARLGDAPRTPVRLTLGDVVEGRYRVVRALGSGGMGQVHEVERISDGKRLALKTLTGVAHKEALARFAREAQVAAELQHPNVVAALDIGVTQTGTLFIVMELVTGGSLAAARARYGDVKFALAALRQIAAALSAMHARGIVHRDLKPANILRDGEQVKVADFGLAGLVDGAPLADTHEDGGAISPALTRTGAIMGTPLYMAPELVGGAREAGPGADVFSFGVVAYELLSRELPFAAPPVIERLSGRDLPVLKPLAQARPELPSLLTSLVDRCLAVAPEGRPSAAVLADAFEGLSKPMVGGDHE